jgi:hypothetical protein
MRSLRVAIKASRPLILVLLLLSFQALAKQVAVVKSVRGKVFASKAGKTWELSERDVIQDFTEIISEEGSQISFYDFYDHKFHLAGAGHVKLLGRIVELKQGYLWVQSFNDNATFTVQTANANTRYKKGEAIISFDSVNGKSQVLSLSGTVQFSNIMEDHLKLDLLPGTFSFVDNSYEHGMPRKPTPIGYLSFKKVVTLYDGIRPIEKNQRLFPNHKTKRPSRALASVEEGGGSLLDMMSKSPSQRMAAHKAPKQRTPASVLTPPTTKGKVILVKQTQQYEPGIRRFNANDYYKKQLHGLKARKRARDPRDYSKRSRVKVKIFGAAGSKQLAPKRTKRFRRLRVPASEPKAAPKSYKKQTLKKSMVPKSMTVDADNYREPAETTPPKLDPFERTLLQEYKYQMRHDKEVNALIRELKSYDKDYKVEY